jgi:hypothetical protein
MAEIYDPEKILTLEFYLTFKDRLSVLRIFLSKKP